MRVSFLCSSTVLCNSVLPAKLPVVASVFPPCSPLPHAARPVAAPNHHKPRNKPETAVPHLPNLSLLFKIGLIPPPGWLLDTGSWLPTTAGHWLLDTFDRSGFSARAPGGARGSALLQPTLLQFWLFGFHWHKVVPITILLLFCICAASSTQKAHLHNWFVCFMAL